MTTKRYLIAIYAGDSIELERDLTDDQFALLQGIAQEMDERGDGGITSPSMDITEKPTTYEP